jgi:hypothetical protein
MTIQNTEASVKIENLNSKLFSISSGVRQDDPLSASIFNLILDSVIKKFKIRGDVSFKLRQIVTYADDVALLDRSLKALKKIFFYCCTVHVVIITVFIVAPCMLL